MTVSLITNITVDYDDKYLLIVTYVKSLESVVIAS